LPRMFSPLLGDLGSMRLRAKKCEGKKSSAFLTELRIKRTKHICRRVK